MLAIGPSTVPYSRGNDNRGLFTTVDVTKGTILCIKTGLLLNKDFWTFSDYSTSNIRVISMIKIDPKVNQPYTFMLDNDNSISYSDFIRDPLNSRLINTEFVEAEEDGIVVLKATKPIQAHRELFISFGKQSWIAEFRSYDWSSTNNDYNAMVINAMSAYSIKKSEIIESIKDFQTSQTIQNYISSHMSWENATKHSYVNVLVWKDSSCYINAVLQCLARIPALTQLLLDTKIFENINTTTFLHRYISLLKLMTETKVAVGTMKKYNNYILDNRTDLKFTKKGQGDAQELFVNLLNKFCDEYPNFQFVRYHLFGFYLVKDIFCSNNHHSVTIETDYMIHLPIYNCKDTSNTSKDTYSLHSGIINSMKTVEIDEKKATDEVKSTEESADKKKSDNQKRKCPYCMFKNISPEEYASFESFKYLHLPNIFVIHLMRTNYVNSNPECDRTSIHYEQYMILPEEKLNIRYELIGLITYKGSAIFGHYVAYILTSKNEWWLLDDMPRDLGGETKPPQKVTEKEVYNQKQFAFLFFYRKHNIATGYNSTIADIDNLEIIEQDIRDKIDPILIENENTSLCTTIDSSDSSQMVQSELVVDFFQLIMPDLIDIMKTEEIDNIFEEMKLLYDEYSGIFQNDSILEPLSRTVVDLTQLDEGDLVKKSKKALKKSPNKSPKKRKWLHVKK